MISMKRMMESCYRNGNKMMIVPIAMEPHFTAGTARPLFEGDYEEAFGGFNQNYDISPDGLYFVLIQSSYKAGELNVKALYAIREGLADPDS